MVRMFFVGPPASLQHLHHHHDWGPHMEKADISNVSVKAGETASLDCRVQLLHDKTVSTLTTIPPLALKPQ